MLKQLFLKKYPLLFFISVILMASCNNGESEKSNTGEVIHSHISTNAETTPLTPNFINGRLDTLWVDSTAFNKLKGKVVFVFTVGGKDTLTLTGWDAKKAHNNKEDTFNLQYDIRLYKANVSPQTYGPNTYFGNMLLKEPDLSYIQNIVTSSKSKYVLFAPEKFGNHIQYNIIASNTISLKINDGITPNLTVTGKTLNPSPPKTY